VENCHPNSTVSIASAVCQVDAFNAVKVNLCKTTDSNSLKTRLAIVWMSDLVKVLRFEKRSDLNSNLVTSLLCTVSQYVKCGPFVCFSRNLTSSGRQLDDLDTSIQETTDRVEAVNNRIEAIKGLVEQLKMMAEELRRNATAIKELDVTGKYYVRLGFDSCTSVRI